MEVDLRNVSPINNFLLITDLFVRPIMTFMSSS